MHLKFGSARLSNNFVPRLKWPQNLRYIKAWLNLFLTTMCVIFVMLYLWTWKCERVLVYTQAKVHQCEFIRLHSQPHPLITWCCNVVDNMSVAVTKTTIPEVLESTLEHEICMKAKYNVTWFCFVKFEAQLHLFRTDKRGLLGGVVKALLVCIKDYSSRLLISPPKILEYTWVPSYMKHYRVVSHGFDVLRKFWMCLNQ